MAAQARPTPSISLVPSRARHRESHWRSEAREMPALFLAPANGTDPHNRGSSIFIYRAAIDTFVRDGSARSGWAAHKTRTLWIAMERSHLGIRAYLRMPAWLSSEKGLCTG